ncbi:MAG: hypothetical protein ACKVZ0_18075 [Gemmatimonadales bacterium]
MATISGRQSSAELAQLTEYTVDADSLGNIYVLNAWFGQRLQLFDTTGRLLRVLTRGGAGPGEVAAGVSVSAGPGGVASIMDFSKAGLVRVSTAGAPLPLLGLVGYAFFGGARASADTVILHVVDDRREGTAEAIRYRTATDTATLATHAVPHLGPLTFCGEVIEGLSPLLAPELHWTARGSTAAISHTVDYRVDVFRHGRLNRSVRRAVPAVRGSAAAVRRFYPQGKVIGSPRCTVPAAELVAARGVSPALQPIRRLAIGPGGSLWAERNTFPDEPTRTDVFDFAGRYEGTLLGIGAPLGFPGARLFLVASPDSAVEPTLRVLRRLP